MGSVSRTDIIDIAAKQDLKAQKSAFEKENLDILNQADESGKSRSFPQDIDFPVNGETSNFGQNFDVKSLICRDGENKCFGKIGKSVPVANDQYVITANKRQGRCFRCKLFGHYVAKCTVKSVFCKLCKQPHHRKIQCHSFRKILPHPRSLGGNLELENLSETEMKNFAKSVELRIPCRKNEVVDSIIPSIDACSVESDINDDYCLGVRENISVELDNKSAVSVDSGITSLND